MKKSTLGIYQFLRNGIKFDYPFKESLRSALQIADEVVVCECDSEDNTLEVLKELQAESEGKLKIVHQSWVTHYSELCNLGNYASLFLNTEWAWQLQADEVIHEDQYDKIRHILEQGVDNYELVHKRKITALTTKYYHFLASYSQVFPFCYEEINRIYKKGYNWRLVGDACQLDGGNVNEILNTDIMVYHYGKVKEGKTGFQKEISFQNLYLDIGFPDPKMKEMKEKLGSDFCDYLYLFESNIREGKVKEFKGAHPKVMEDRIKRFKDNGWEQFTSIIKEDLKID